MSLPEKSGTRAGLGEGSRVHKRSNGDNEGKTEKTRRRGRDRAERGRVARAATDTSGFDMRDGPLVPVAALATQTPATAGVTPHVSLPPRIFFSVRPPFAPFLRCELR